MKKKEHLTINDLTPEVVESMREEIRASKEYQSLLIKKNNLLKQCRYMEAMNLSRTMEEVETLAIKEYLRHYEGEVRKVNELTASMTEEDKEMMSAYGNSLVMLADVMETMCIECNQLIQKYHPSFRIEMFDKLTELGKEAKKHVRMLDDYSTDDFYTSAYGDATDKLCEMAVNKAKGFIRKIKRHEESVNKKAPRHTEVA